MKLIQELNTRRLKRTLSSILVLASCCCPLAAKDATPSTAKTAEGNSGDTAIQLNETSAAVDHAPAKWKESKRFLAGIKLIEAGKLQEAKKLIPAEWVNKHAALIQESKPGPLLPGEWGFSQAKGDKVTLFIRNWQPGHVMQLPNTELAIINAKTKSLSGGKVKLKWAIGLEIFMDRPERDPVATVIEYTVKGDAESMHQIHVPDWRDPSINAPEEMIKKWRDLRFGLFVHWGPCSVAGQEISWTRRASKMGRLRYGGSGVNGKYKADPKYDQLYKQFNPVKFDADAWVTMAKNAGMKYIVLITKHHDGFALFDSKVSDYDIMATPYGKDIAKMLADACRKQGIKLGFYYSPRDWYDTNFGRESTHDQYNDFYMEQLRELGTNYGKIDIFWYDCLDSPQYLWKDIPERSTQMLRKLQPTMMINDRGGLRGDFDTPEQRVGGFEMERPWETCATISNGWSWNTKQATNTKSLAACLSLLINTAGRDGNLLLNLGPKADGTFEEIQVQRLAEVGKWMKQYGHTIHGTRGGPILPAKDFVSTNKGKSIYLHLLKSQMAVRIPHIDASILKATVLNGGTVSIQKNASDTLLTLEDVPSDQIDIIIELQIDKEAESLPIVQ